jgi:predicted aldo/keto reductase-like oxidoreductase
MDYRALGRTGVKVSAVSLGTMTFGQQNTQTEGHAQMDYALDRGINVFDAAELSPSRRGLRPKGAPKPSSAPGLPRAKPATE